MFLCRSKQSPLPTVSTGRPQLCSRHRARAGIRSSWKSLTRLLSYMGSRQDQVPVAQPCIWSPSHRSSNAVWLSTWQCMQPPECAGLTCSYGLVPAQHNLKSPVKLVDDIVERVVKQLKDLGRVPRDYVLTQGRRPALWTLSRTTDSLVGREDEVEVVLASLRQHGAAVIWGGPGEGKTTVAMEAAARLHVDEPALSAFKIDMRGERAALLCSRVPWQVSIVCVMHSYALVLPRSDEVKLPACAVQVFKVWVTTPSRTPASAPRQHCASASSMLQRRWLLSTCAGRCATGSVCGCGCGFDCGCWGCSASGDACC